MYCDICDYTNHNTCDCYRLKSLIKKYKAAFMKSNANYTSLSENESVNDGYDDDDDGEYK